MPKLPPITFNETYNFMSIEKFIHGKHDKGRHEGKASELRRLAETNQSLKDWKEGVILEVHDTNKPLPERRNPGDSKS
jgi:hypothetical protein